VLGANDGILSTASLVLGVAAANGSRSSVLIAGFAGLIAGAMSMAAGEYVSVHSKKDTEEADLALERRELRTDDSGEHKELAAIYVGRGLDRALAKQVADQLMAHDALDAHARGELGISTTLQARPIQAELRRAKSRAHFALKQAETLARTHRGKLAGINAAIQAGDCKPGLFPLGHSPLAWLEHSKDQHLFATP